jgi:hypothetical protein
MGMTYKRDAVWWVKYYLNGRPIRESSHSAKESDAIKTRSVFERYKIVSECDLVEAAKKLNLLQPVPPASDRDGLAATKPCSGEVGHNSGTVSPDRGSRLRVSL